MTGPIRQSTGERIHDAFVESPTRSNKTAVEVVPSNTVGTPLYVYQVNGGGGGGTLTNQTIAQTITVPQINTWVLVPTTGLLQVFTVEVFDATNTIPLFIDYRISLSNVLEIKSNAAQTYTLRIIGSS